MWSHLLLVLLPYHVTCSPSAQARVGSDCSWLWTILRVNPTNSEMKNSSFISIEKKVLNSSNNKGNRKLANTNSLNDSIQMLMVYKESGCVSALHWLVEGHMVS